MASRTCLNCVYAICDPEEWMRCAWRGESMVPQCANHPARPGQLQDVTGVPCRNYRPKPVEPTGDHVRWVPLTDGSYAYVDAADYEWLRQWNWHLCSSGYAARRDKSRLVLMHREIMQPPKGMVTDHIDGNKVNNCRFNLRVCTRRENMHNKRKNAGAVSPFKGVGYYRRCRKWYARIWFRGERIWLGYFTEEVEAARAYDRKAVELFGEYARLNFPREWPPERRAEVYAQHPENGRKTRGGRKVGRKEGPRGAPGKNPRTARRPKTKERRRRIGGAAS